MKSCSKECQEAKNANRIQGGMTLSWGAGGRISALNVFNTLEEGCPQEIKDSLLQFFDVLMMLPGKSVKNPSTRAHAREAYRNLLLERVK
jgi:hypothetical protein